MSSCMMYVRIKQPSIIQRHNLVRNNSVAGGDMANSVKVQCAVNLLRGSPGRTGIISPVPERTQVAEQDFFSRVFELENCISVMRPDQIVEIFKRQSQIIYIAGNAGMHEKYLTDSFHNVLGRKPAA